MSKVMDEAELCAHCKNAVAELERMLEQFRLSPVKKIKKRAMLVAYWFKTYARYLRTEDSFSPQIVFRLKRGSVIRVEFGYRVGRELGGRHYAVVLDNNNALGGNTVTVIPLASLKENSCIDRYNIKLQDGIFTPVYKKLDALIKQAESLYKEVEQGREDAEKAPIEERPTLWAIVRSKEENARAMIEQAREWISEIELMKQGSIALVGQLTTISKMRISQPLKKTHPLYGVRLTSEDLNAIDQGIENLYLPAKKEEANCEMAHNC